MFNDILNYPDNWVEGEEVTFTLYDSPAKTKKLYSRTLDLASKWHKWVTAFEVHNLAKPDTEYYFELTRNSGGLTPLATSATMTSSADWIDYG